MKILFVDCCISQRGENARTALLCDSFLKQSALSGAKIEHLELGKARLEPFDADMLDRRDALAASGDFGDPMFALASQFRSAGGIVVGAPFWDLSFPSQLRIYIEHISANGLTYYYDEQGPHGSCAAKWLVYLSTGGDFGKPENLGVLYWKQLCAMFGIREYYSVFSGGLDADPENAEKYLKSSCDEAAGLALRLPG